MARRSRFSIIIPTRNRARLLGCAIRSALAQTHEDFELVVVNNASVDTTADVVAGFTDARVRAVHSTKSRLMHDNWMFALEQARGEYVLFLCDDDAWHPRLLEIVDGTLRETASEVVCWRSITHYSNDWFEESRRGTVNCGPPWSDRRFEIDPGVLLDAAFDMRITISDIVPRMLNTAVSAELIKRIRERDLRMFRPCNPDYSCFIAMALHARGMMFLDAPMLVSGATPMSVGASATQRGETARKFLEELLEHEPDLVMLPPPRTQAHWIAQTFEQCRREIPELSRRELNRVHLYGLAGLEIRRSALAGVDVADWEREFEHARAGPLRDVRDEIERFIAAGRSIETDRFLKCVDGTAVLGGGACFVAPGELGAMENASIDECALRLDQWISDRAQSLDATRQAMVQRAGERTCVIYGLGLNGRAVVRSLSTGGERFASFDDGSDLNPSQAPRLAEGTRLDPRKHFVLMTPYESSAIQNKLMALGFVPQRDVMALVEAKSVVGSGTTGNSALTPALSRPRMERESDSSITCAAGSPSGCR